MGTDKQASINQLKASVQILSLEAHAQLAAFPDFVVVTDDMLEDFHQIFTALKGNFPNFCTTEQLQSLEAIDLFSNNIPDEDPNEAIAQELHNSEFWKQMRVLAKKALVRFQWDSAPPPDYEEGF